MKQSVSIFKNIFLFFIGFALFLTSCKKDKDNDMSKSSFVGQYLVVDDNETYTLKIESKGNNNFQIREFGGFLNAPLNATANGSTLTIPMQTFTNPNGHVIKIVGSGVLSTKTKKDDTVTFQYSVTGFADYSGDFTGTRK